VIQSKTPEGKREEEKRKGQLTGRKRIPFSAALQANPTEPLSSVQL